MLRVGDIKPYDEAVRLAQANLQKGMSFRPRGKTSIFVMSRRRNAPYDDRLGDDGTNLVYQGHDIRKVPGGPDPASVDQPLTQEDGVKPSDNAKFLRAADLAKGGAAPELVRVWEKIATGIWVYNGVFELLDAWSESDGRRRVFRFKLRIVENQEAATRNLTNVRFIPSAVKAEVWARDGGRCVICKETDNLHYDHELPFSKGGTSLLSSNIRILCARHNLAKSDKIE